MRATVTFVSFVLAACSSQQVQLQPQPIAPVSSFAAHGELITLAVRDERPSETIGTRGTNVRYGDITAAGDVPSVVAASLTEVLQKAGFRVQVSSPTAAALVVDLRDLSFAEHQGLVTNKREANAAVNARVMRNGAIIFEKLYRGSSAGHSVTIGTAHGNAAIINSALSDAIEHLASDGELYAALASR